MSHRVRQAGNTDLAAVLRLASSAPEAPVWSEAVYRELLQHAARSPHRVLLVAEWDGRIAGFAVGAVVLDEADLESVVVEPAARRQGIGRALCAAIAHWAQAAGARQMRLEVRASNAGAQALYRQAGFEHTGVRRAYYVDPVEDAVLMSVILPGPAL